MATVLDTLKAHMQKKVKELELAAMPPYYKRIIDTNKCEGLCEDEALELLI